MDVVQLVADFVFLTWNNSIGGNITTLNVTQYLGIVTKWLYLWLIFTFRKNLARNITLSLVIYYLPADGIVAYPKELSVFYYSIFL